MRNKILFAAAIVSLGISLQVNVQASVLDNETIGLKMEIDDQDQFVIHSGKWLPLETDDCLLSTFSYQDEDLAYLVTIGDEGADSESMKHISDVLTQNDYIQNDTVSKNGYTYQLYYWNAEEGSEEKLLIQSILDAFKQAEFTAPVFPEVHAIDLKATTLDGEEVGAEIFKEKDYTMINVWATDCNPCLNELPELAEWEQELPDNVQILYLDLESNGIESADTDMIEMIIQKTGINRDHVLLCERGFSEAIDSLVHATPTTLFVDSNGNIAGNIVLGARVDDYKEVFKGLVE